MRIIHAKGICSECADAVWMRGMCRKHYHSIWLPNTKERMRKWDEKHQGETVVILPDDPLDIPREPMPVRVIDRNTVPRRAGYFLPGL